MQSFFFTPCKVTAYPQGSSYPRLGNTGLVFQHNMLISEKILCPAYPFHFSPDNTCFLERSVAELNNLRLSFCGEKNTSPFF